jgi:HupE / UreJ protein
MKALTSRISVSSVARILERRPPARRDGNSKLHSTRHTRNVRNIRRPAECNSAIRQIENLRYLRAGPVAGAPIVPRFVLCLLFVLFCAGRAAAHDPGLSTAALRWEPDRLEVTLAFSVVDAGQISAAAGAENFSRTDLARATTGMSERATNALLVKCDDQPAAAIRAKWHFDDRDNASLSLVFSHGPCSKLFVQSRWLANLPPGHRQLLALKNAGGQLLDEQWLSADSDSATIQIADAESKPEPATSARSFVNFLGLGVKHIWTGYDHLLFLFGLLIATKRFVASLKVITCFTLAHSITLAVATLSRVEFPGRIVEPLIAASIVYVGIENLVRHGDPARRGLLTFAFGLIHGFGFASVLRELGIDAMPGGVALPLFSFNLGVELGQIAVAAALLPLLWKLKAKPAFATRWMPAGSVIVALLGGYWLVERLLT